MAGFRQRVAGKAVQGQTRGLRSDHHGRRAANIAAGHDGLESYPGVLIHDALVEQAERSLQAIPPPSHHPRGIGTRPVVFRLQQALEQGPVDHLV